MDDESGDDERWVDKWIRSSIETRLVSDGMNLEVDSKDEVMNI